MLTILAGWGLDRGRRVGAPRLGLERPVSTPGLRGRIGRFRYEVKPVRTPDHPMEGERAVAAYSSFEHLLVEFPEDNIALVRLNRPQVLNALSTALLRELEAALEQLDAD